MDSKKSVNNYDTIYKKYHKKREKLKEMGGEKAVKKQHKSLKLTARERLEYFFDGGAFTEKGLYVQHRTTKFGMDKKIIPADALIIGFGKVSGRYVVVAAEDFTCMAGTFGEYHGRKFSEAMQMAKEMGVPFVGLNDSGGARLQEGIDTLQSYSWLFNEQILASGIIPQIAVVMGPCVGGQAYHPVMQDFIVQCKNTGFMGIASPAFVKTQLGQEISMEDLCGVGAQAVKSGCTHLVAENDKEALDIVKRMLSFIPSNNTEKPPRLETTDNPEREAAELDTLMPVEHFKVFDMHEVINRIVDNGDFMEIHKDFAKNILVGFARFDGRPVGIIANQPNHMAGVLDCDAVDKAARFIRFCDLFNIALINLHDTPGYLIGSAEEWKGILRHGAPMLYAYVEATVPKITVMLRKSYAGAYAGMCCKGTGADFVYAWPNARISIVGGATAASVIFAREIRNSDNPEITRIERIKAYEDEFENPYEAAKRGYVDDVIMPRKTRKIINRSLDLLSKKKVSRPYRKYSNINL